MKKVEITITKAHAHYKVGDTAKVVKAYADLVIGKGWAVEGAAKKSASMVKKSTEVKEEAKPK